mgnify:FL=1
MLRKEAASTTILESMETLIERPSCLARSTYINAKVFKKLSESFSPKLRDSTRHAREDLFGVVPSGTQASSKLQSRPSNVKRGVSKKMSELREMDLYEGC